MELHLPGRSHKPEVHADPGRPHEFVRIDDPGIGALAAGGGTRGSGMAGITSIAVTDNYIRKSRCGLPGCGREQGDEIHAAAEA